MILPAMSVRAAAPMIRPGMCVTVVERTMQQAMSVRDVAPTIRSDTFVRAVVPMMLLAMSAAVAAPMMPPVMTVVAVVDVARMTFRAPIEPRRSQGNPGRFATLPGLFSLFNSGLHILGRQSPGEFR
jgi:hypothetical protein